MAHYRDMTSSWVIGFSRIPTYTGLMTSYLGDESSDTKILITALCVFRSDYSPEIRLGLSITVLEKKKEN